MAITRAFDTVTHREPRRLPVRRFFAGLTTFWSALRDASAAAHAYETLTRRGVPHAEAVERVLEEHFSDRR